MGFCYSCIVFSGDEASDQNSMLEESMRFMDNVHKDIYVLPLIRIRKPEDLRDLPILYSTQSKVKTDAMKDVLRQIDVDRIVRFEALGNEYYLYFYSDAKFLTKVDGVFVEGVVDIVTTGGDGYCPFGEDNVLFVKKNKGIYFDTTFNEENISEFYNAEHEGLYSTEKLLAIARLYIDFNARCMYPLNNAESIIHLDKLLFRTDNSSKDRSSRKEYKENRKSFYRKYKSIIKPVNIIKQADNVIISIFALQKTTNIDVLEMTFKFYSDGNLEISERVVSEVDG